ncbi:CDP-glycerol glycerophosphotransferase family protein [Streptomyces sp. MP131-18]|uniref:bifunctional glycosyltransferase/CDP-glycerol:glycerophosphate glycerophosphotransferase n=1 Tax=Streptomyces sp. MP131-18 TaxID=1857892 RepID=UPI00097C87EE|nr:CDP-glycerol glycerophosphotransferase family protein [Streptomyces sp. MP131-18]ONK13928.1 CDP-glycerol:poly(glycerophosphate) glycerophosphotransferase [Streptomyces sp. MP131-18]
MPRFSIIVPAHQVQAYLPACLTSVLSQDFQDVELIAVDDASPDACRDIIAETAAADPRVTGLRLPRTAGPGPARNAGLDHASGDYLLFLDGDDTLTPGALAAIAARLAATGDPQLLLFGHARAAWHGAVTPGTPPGALAERGPRTFTLAERPALLRLPPVAWAAAYRRDLIDGLDLRFPPGHYQDLPFVYPALTAAASVAVLDRSCVHHRERRTGGRARAAGRGHLDVLTQYDRVFAQLATLPGGDRWRAAIHRRMVDHLTAVYRMPGRLPAADRAEFFRRSGALCRRHRAAAGATALGGRRRTAGLRQLLLRLGARRAFHLLLSAHRVAGRLRARTRGRLRGRLLRVHYRLQLRRPLDRKLAVFSTESGGYTGHPAAIEAKLRELAPAVRTAWITRPGPGPGPLPEGVPALTPGTRRYLRAVARARYLVSDAAFPDTLVKRPGQLRLQTHGGTPLAHVGLDVPHRDIPRLLRQIDRWDYCLSANRHTTLAWEGAYPATYLTLEYGSPRADVFHTATAADVLRVRAGLGIPDGVLAVLYAPARRGYDRGHLPGVDPARLARDLGPGFLLLLRAPGGTAGYGRTGAGVLDVTAHPRIEELCLAADALVTDYAPVLFDYAGLDRPIVLHADDWEVYRAVHGVYLDLPAAAPGPVTRTQEELTAVLTGHRLWTDPRGAAQRAAFRRQFCPYADGFAAERVVRQVFLGGRRVPPAVPPEARRPAPGAVALRAAGAPRPRSARPAYSGR